MVAAADDGLDAVVLLRMQCRMGEGWKSAAAAAVAVIDGQKVISRSHLWISQ